MTHFNHRSAVSVNSIWRNTLTGDTYIVVGHCVVEEDPAVLYRLCYNPLRKPPIALAESKFLDGRFERLPESIGRPLGDMFWLADDPEYPLEWWSTPVDERWDHANCVYEIMTGLHAPTVFVVEEVITRDEDGDPDETQAVWFSTRAEAEAVIERNKAEHRAS